MLDFDVIIIGGGPSGLQSSCLLSKKGLNVALFEKDNNIGEDVVCSGVISKEAFLRYDLPEASLTGKLSEAELHSPSNEKILYTHNKESVLVVNRNLFDSLLAKKSEDAGTQFFLNSRVVSLDPHDDFIEAKVNSDGDTKVIRAKIAIIATGISFNLQTKLGMGRPKKILKGIQVELDSVGLERLQMFWGNNYSKGFFGWAIPLLNGNTKIGVMTEENGTEGLLNILKKLKIYDRYESGELKIKRRGISFGSIKRKYSNRVLAVGEAAGFVKTTTGGGIYYGLISGELASEVAVKAFRKNNFEAEVLSEYDILSKNEFSKEIKFGEYFHRFYSLLNDREINQLFEAAKKDNLLSYISSEGKFDWHKNAVVSIFKSPNLRKVLLRGLIKQGTSKLVLTG